MMNRAVLISIRPEWAQKIVTGEKTVEIRKTRPNMKPPFRCYIYLTKQRKPFTLRTNGGASGKRYDGKVLAEFTCDKINRLVHIGYSGSCEKPVLRACKADHPLDIDHNFDFAETCMSTEEIEQYLDGGDGYAWHITNARIFYSLPVELSEFTGVRASGTWLELYEIQRAPQSWCYVEELDDG